MPPTRTHRMDHPQNIKDACGSRIGRHFIDESFRFLEFLLAKVKPGRRVLLAPLGSHAQPRFQGSDLFGALPQPRLFSLGNHRALASLALTDEKKERRTEPEDQRHGHRSTRCEKHLVAANQLLKTIEVTRRTSDDRFIVTVTL